MDVPVPLTVGINKQNRVVLVQSGNYVYVDDPQYLMGVVAWPMT